MTWLPWTWFYAACTLRGFYSRRPYLRVSCTRFFSVPGLCMRLGLTSPSNYATLTGVDKNWNAGFIKTKTLLFASLASNSCPPFFFPCISYSTKRLYPVFLCPSDRSVMRVVVALSLLLCNWISLQSDSLLLLVSYAVVCVYYTSRASLRTTTRRKSIFVVHNT